MFKRIGADLGGLVFAWCGHGRVEKLLNYLAMHDDNVGDPHWRRWIARRGKRKRASKEAFLFSREEHHSIAFHPVIVEVTIELRFYDARVFWERA